MTNILERILRSVLLKTNNKGPTEVHLKYLSTTRISKVSATIVWGKQIIVPRSGSGQVEGGGEREAWKEQQLYVASDDPRVANPKRSKTPLHKRKRPNEKRKRRVRLFL